MKQKHRTKEKKKSPKSQIGTVLKRLPVFMGEHDKKQK